MFDLKMAGVHTGRNAVQFLTQSSIAIMTFKLAKEFELRKMGNMPGFSS